MSPSLVFTRSLAIAVLVLLGPTMAHADDTIIADGDARISRAEFEAVLDSMPEGVRRRAANDLGDRLEFISGLLETRKLAARADAIPADDPDYWDLQFALISTKQKFMFQREMDALRIPNAEALAEEWYRTRRQEFARVPETRASSHILLASAPGLSRDSLRLKAQQILDELRAGADFEEMVQEHSQDPGSKKRNGSLDKWVRLGDPGITPPYTGALFEIGEVGGYSDVTDSQFGLHIIRLDGIREASFKSYEEVRPAIFNAILADYRTLAASAVRARYRISDEAFIDGAAMEQLFSDYKD